MGGSGCFDLHEVNLKVIGHQVNVGVNYYETLSNAQGELNKLDRFYEPLSNPQTIYARVDNLINSQFAIEECILEAASPGGIPAGMSPCNFDVCDVDNSGGELVNLNNLRCIYSGYAFPTVTFCGSNNSDVVTNYYTTEDDAINETNEVVSETFLVSGIHTIYRKIKNTNTSESFIDDLLRLTLVSCSVDTDFDGIPDLVEDANKNLIYTDDNTDSDSLKNYEDADDDNDGILTKDEDYNGNGDPTDDDTDGSGVADYLEANVTLLLNKLRLENVKVFPNPVDELIFVESKKGIKSYRVYNVLGEVVLEGDFIKKKGEIEINTKQMLQGTYILELKSDLIIC